MTPGPKPLKNILPEGASIQGNPDVLVTDIRFDSRQIKPGAVYVALPGVHLDGHDFVREAVNAGAAAVIVQKSVPSLTVPVVRVADTHKALGTLALKFWENPSRQLRMLGITGTNGKTTTSYLLESILTVAGFKPGLLGTVQYRFNGKSIPASNTTPFASDLHRFLAEVRDGGGKACVMEVSSHALSLGRVEGIDWDLAVFTNLTQDHLDFHGSMDAYAEAKAKLFASLSNPSSKKTPKAAILNADDPYSERMRKEAKVPVRTYAVHGHADLKPHHLSMSASGSRWTMTLGGKPYDIHFPLIGDYNVSNALAAASAAEAVGIAPGDIVKGLEQCAGVPGRMERVDEGQPFTVVVDYAHTDDALKQILTTLRHLKPARLITVFGCGGDRDRTKRPLMGETAARLSDEILVTSDNPRSEDPERITLDVEVGIRRVRNTNYQIIVDRETAIRAALQMAKANDVVLLAGKGHETYQIIGEQRLPFDDRDVARRILRTLSE